MTTFTWATAASGSWTSPTFWTGGGAGSWPGSSGGDVDTADITAPGTVTLQSPAYPDLVGLVISDPDAVLQVDGGLAVEVTVQNAGTIALGANAVVTAGNLGEPTLGLYANTGIISIGSGASFTVFAPCTTAALGTVQFNGGTLVLANPLDNTGAVIAAASFGNLDIGGVVTGGTIVNDGGNMQIVDRIPQGDGFGAAVQFDDVAFQGVLAPDGPLAITGGFTLTPLAPGGLNTIDLTGSTSVPGTLLPDLHGQIVALDAMTIDNADLLLGDLQAVTTITLGAGVTATNAGMGFLGGAGSFASSATITNTGTLAINNAGVFANAGVLTNQGGTITDDNGGTLANSGMILLNGGQFTAPVTGTGTLQLGNGATAELTSDYGQLAFNYLDATGTLRLDHPGGSNLVQGFVPGDTIVLVGTPGTVSFAAGALTVANGTVAIANFLMPDQPGDAVFDSTIDPALDTVITEWLACFAAGTRIATASGATGATGATAVEALRPGDRVRLAGGGTAPVLWIGHRRVACRRHPRPWDVLPVRVCVDAFAPGAPARDLWLSPDHAVFMDGALIPIRYLINGRTIVQECVAQVTYFHVELPAHAVILAEGLPCESYLDTGNRAAFANGGDAIALHPDFARHAWAARGCFPLALDGPRVVNARRRLLARASQLGHVLTDDPALRLGAGGVRLRPTIEGATWRVRLPAAAASLQLRSRVWVPAETRPQQRDTRALGIAVANLRLDGAPVALDDARLSSGWHAPEDGWRWTDGDAGIALGAARELEFDIAMTGSYWRTAAPGGATWRFQA